MDPAYVSLILKLLTQNQLFFFFYIFTYNPGGSRLDSNKLNDKFIVRKIRNERN